MLHPIGPKVIVEVKKVEMRSQGGIYLTEKIVDQDQMAVCEGTIVGIGDSAWDWLKNRSDGEHLIPKVGDQIKFVKYAGKGEVRDGKEYRIMNDEDIFAIVEEQENDK